MTKSRNLLFFCRTASHASTAYNSQLVCEIGFMHPTQGVLASYHVSKMLTGRSMTSLETQASSPAL